MMNKSNRVSLGQIRVVGDDIIHDIMALKACVSALARQARDLSTSVRVSA